MKFIKINPGKNSNSIKNLGGTSHRLVFFNLDKINYLQIFIDYDSDIFKIEISTDKLACYEVFDTESEANKRLEEILSILSENE
jgi:hypothetical protein